MRRTASDRQPGTPKHLLLNCSWNSSHAIVVIVVLLYQSTRPAWGAVRFVKQIEHVPYVSIYTSPEDVTSNWRGLLAITTFVRCSDAARHGLVSIHNVYSV
jgi:hypothetical protein